MRCLQIRFRVAFEKSEIFDVSERSWGVLGDPFGVQVGPQKSREGLWLLGRFQGDLGCSIGVLEGPLKNVSFFFGKRIGQQSIDILFFVFSVGSFC